MYAKNDSSASRLSEAKGGGPANSSQQPTRGRSLVRRFRASFCATLRVALLAREGRARLSERTLGGRNHVPSPRKPSEDVRRVRDKL